MHGEDQSQQKRKSKNVAAQRHHQSQKPVLEGITRGDLRRLARKGGVVRLAMPIYDHSRKIMRVFLRDLLKNAIIYTTACKRKTVTGMDVAMAMKRQGCSLYGM